MKISIPSSRQEAEALDLDDPLQHARAAFLLPAGVIYLDGHSLGPATHKALARVEEVARKEWADGLIGSWNGSDTVEGWIDLPAILGARIAGLIGAQHDEVIITDSVSVNLFKLAAAALNLSGSRTLLVEESEFPTDQYVLEGLADIAGAELKRVPENQGAKALASKAAVLVKSAVNYRSALIADMAGHEEAAKASGGVIVWDLSHAAGVIDLDLADAGCWLAAGCTYKFLNGGPGAPAYVFVRGDLAERLRSPIPGWMGHAAPFDFAPVYLPKPGAARFACGTPGILSLAALEGALSAFDGVDPKLGAQKARRLGDLVIERAQRLKLDVISPLNGGLRGGHVSVRHPNAYALVQALAARGVIADFRAPDAMRLGVSPLFLRYADVWDAMDILADILETRAWDKPEFQTRAAVT